ncbi:hypothetical protein GGI10_003949 [Coemansia sp. RSA 2530]|nr:hypothetical protein GGI10_003949 [Coemansia sp. RSA 2530]
MRISGIVDSFSSPAMMSGVGDAEVTDEERAMARAVSHELFCDISGHQGFPPTGPSDEPAIPPDVGSYRIFDYAMPATQPPYQALGDDYSLKLLNALHSEDLAGQCEHSMVVSVSATLPSKGDMLGDKPLSEDERIVVYLPGGAFIGGDTPGSKWMYIRMSMELGLRVFTPRYHVAPAFRYPRPVHDVCTAIAFLVACGFRPQNIVVVGASAGANIGLSALRLLAGSIGVAGCVVVEPCLDLTLSLDSWQRNQEVCVLPYVSPTHPGSISRMYLGPVDGMDAVELLGRPLLSPLFADVGGLPPMQIQVGMDDVLYDECVAFAKRIPTAEFITYPGINHYTMFRGRTQLGRFYGNLLNFVTRVTSKRVVDDNK